MENFGVGKATVKIRLLLKKARQGLSNEGVQSEEKKK